MFPSSVHCRDSTTDLAITEKNVHYQSIVLGIGTGRCGTASLAKMLNQQPDAQCFVRGAAAAAVEGRRCAGACPGAVRPVPAERQGAAVGRRGLVLPAVPGGGHRRWSRTSASSALKRPREEVVTSFCEWLDQTMPLPTNHWAEQPAPGWHHDPNRTRTFPQYDTQNREEGIRRYWDEYYRRVGELAAPLSGADPPLRHLRGAEHRERGCGTCWASWEFRRSGRC